MGMIEKQGWMSRLTPAQILIFTFASLILVGSILLSLPVASNVGRLPYLDALFTATSAVCVTGLVVADTLTQFSFFGQVVIIILIQFGGLGLMTMATMMAIFLGKRISFRNRLIMQEALNQFSLEGMVRLTLYVGLVTLFFEGIGAVLLTLRFLPDYGMPTAIWYGIFHAISAFCNAGFDLIGNYRSLTPYVSDIPVNLIVTTLIIAGGLGFSVLADIYQHRGQLKFSRLSFHSRIVLAATAALLVIGFVFVLALEWNNTLADLPTQGKLLGAWFHSVTPRTAGFNTLPTDALRPATLLLTIILMFIGASPGSTGGGIKTSTFSALFLMVVASIRGREDARLFGRQVPRDIIMRAMAIAAIALGLVLTTTMVLTISEDQPFLPLLFEATSAFGTVGLSMGITSSLSAVGRVVLIITMFAGRVGPMTLALAVAHSNTRAHLRYPEEKIIVG